jgi:uncharacterized protein (DUF2225 family)
MLKQEGSYYLLKCIIVLGNDLNVLREINNFFKYNTLITKLKAVFYYAFTIERDKKVTKLVAVC